MNGPASIRSKEPLGALLRGGASRRMGRPKAVLELDGRPMFAWVAAAISAVTPTTVQVGGRKLPGLGWPRVPDLRSGAGPAAGIETALVRAGGRPVIVAAVDTPFVPASLLRHLLRLVESGAVAAAPRWRDRWYPLQAAYAPDVLGPLRRRLDRGRHDLHGLLDELGARPVGRGGLAAFGDPDRLLVNVNDAGDLRRARSHTSG